MQTMEEKLRRLLERLVSAARAMDVGIAKHNELSQDAPARLKDIEGPVVSELRSAYAEARNWLIDNSPRG